jgi:hypothetical protein
MRRGRTGRLENACIQLPKQNEWARGELTFGLNTCIAYIVLFYLPLGSNRERRRGYFLYFARQNPLNNGDKSPCMSDELFLESERDYVDISRPGPIRVAVQVSFHIWCW